MRPTYFDDTAVSKSAASDERARETLREWERKTWTIECVLPSGALLWRTYWRDGGGKVCDGITVPGAPTGE